MHAPELSDVECLNTLRRLVRCGEITEADGDAATEGLQTAHILRYRHRILRERAWGYFTTSRVRAERLRAGRGNQRPAAGHGRQRAA